MSNQQLSNEIIIIEQLPILKERLQEISADIQKDIDSALSLECTKESKQAVKKTKAELAKKFADFEEKRKSVKTAILEPYTDFEKLYNELIADKFKGTKLLLDGKINEIEDFEKEMLRIEALEYFNEYHKNNDIDFVTFETIIPKVNLSDNPTKLKKVITEYLDRVSDDLALIDTQENKAEILVEYKKSLNASTAITTVSSRHKAIQEEKLKQEMIEKLEEVVKTIDKPSPDESEWFSDSGEPLADDENILTSDFGSSHEISKDELNPVRTQVYKITHKASKLKELEQFLYDGGYGYEYL